VCFPAKCLQRWRRDFIFLSYKEEPPNDNPNASTQYGKGLWDIAFVSLPRTPKYIAVYICSMKRACFVRDLMRETARGRIIMRQTPVWYFNTRGMYELFPHRTHAAEFKFYYLFARLLEGE
jgi:acyl-CoA-dependent ceramide synthase